jgi:CRP/FNR family cyclic AMP-dependent transcriptional regulator
MAVTNPTTRLAALRLVPLFCGLTQAALFEVARRSTEVAYPPGAIVVRQGDPGDCLCVIMEGTVEVRRDDRAIAQKSVGEYFGEISLIDGEPRSATVVAVDDVVLLTLSSSDFDSLLNIPHVARVALRGLATLFREAQGAHEPERF